MGAELTTPAEELWRDIVSGLADSGYTYAPKTESDTEFLARVLQGEGGAAGEHLRKSLEELLAAVSAEFGGSGDARFNSLAELLALTASSVEEFVPSNAETTTYVATASPTPSDAIIRAIDEAITAWKASGAWSKISAGYFFGLSLSNIKNPGTFDATSTGTLTDNLYIATNGTTTFVTLPNPTTLTGYAQNSAHFALRRLNVGQAAVRGNGWYDGSDGIGITERSTTDTYSYRINSALSTAANNALSVPLGDSFVHANRSGSGATQFYLDGIVQTDAAASANRTSTALNNNVMYLGRGSSSEYFAGQYFSCFLGASMTADEAASLAAGEKSVLLAMRPATDFISGQRSPLATQDLPDGLGGDTGKGFTCTGLVCALDGSGLWFSNDGRNVDGDSSYQPSLVKTDMTGAIKLAEIDLLATYGSLTSVQGLDIFDNGDFAIGSLGDNTFKRMTAAGVHVGGFNATGINGVALDKPNNKLFWGTTTGVVYTNLDGTSSTTVLSGLTDLDHLHYNADRKWLFVSMRDNGQLGVVVAYDVTIPGSPVVVRAWVLNAALSVEGIWFDDQTGILYVAHDGYFHSSGNQLNQLQTYQL
jgi:hypothetical protein